MKSHGSNSVDDTSDRESSVTGARSHDGRVQAASPDADELGARVMMASLADRLFDASEPVRVGRFQILRTLGRGGMGIVYAAADPTLQRQVALKILRPEVHGAEEGRTRMVREGRAMAKLDHPGVLRVFEVGEIDNQVYVVTELAEGGTLGDWLARESRPLDAVLDRFLEAGRGLAAAHEHGLVHRDFKPHNVFIRADGRACVGDFSLARALELPDTSTQPQGRVTLDDDAIAEHARSAFAGTPGYMSPEQAAGMPVDARADQFAFCVTLHEAIHGVRPDQARGGQRSIPRALRIAIERGLQSDPAARFPDMAALLSRIAAVRRRKRRRLRTVGLLLATGFVGRAALSSGDATSPAPCTGAPERLAAVWSPSHAAELRGAFEETGVAGAADMASRVSGRLDDYGRRWVDEYRARCEDTRLRGLWSEPQFSGAVDCLEDQRGVMQALVQRLSSADEASVEWALSSVFALDDPGRCGELERLQARAKMEPPPEQAAAVAALRSELHHVRAEVTTGHESTVADRAQALDVQAIALAHPPLQADTGLLLGRIERNLQRHDLAAKHLESSYFAAIRAGDFERACKAAAELVDISATWLGQPEQGELWRKHASVALEKGPSAECQTRLGFSEANAANSRGDYQSALDGLDRIEIAPQNYDDRIQQAAIRSEALTRLGRTDESQQVLLQGIADASETLGPSHPQVCRLRMALGVALGQGEDYAGAREQFTLALEILEVSVAPNDRRIAQVLGNLAQSMTGDADHEVIRGHLLRALEIYRLYPETMRHRGVFIIQGLGALAYEEDDFAEAERYFIQTVDLLAETRGPEHYLTALMRGNLGAVQLEQGRFEDARATYDVALKGIGASVGETHPEYVRLLGEIKGLHTRAGNDAEASKVEAEIERISASLASE